MSETLENVKEGIGRKLGPLPVWGWALAVAGAVIGFRMLSGRSAFPASSGSTGGVSTIPSDGVDGSQGAPGTIPDLTDIMSTIAGLSGGLSNANTFNTLQQQLITALNTRATEMVNIERLTRGIADNTTAYKDGKISKATYDSRISIANQRIAVAQTSLTNADKLIADMQTQISKIGTPA